jgi:hypothetical protein
VLKNVCLVENLMSTVHLKNVRFPSVTLYFNFSDKSKTTSKWIGPVNRMDRKIKVRKSSIKQKFSGEWTKRTAKKKADGGTVCKQILINAN